MSFSDIQAQFISLTGCSTNEAQFYLEATNNDINSAMNMWVERNSSSSGQTNSPAPVSSYTPPSRSGGVRTFRDISKEEKNDDNTYYAGGEKSGLAVQDPHSGKKDEDFVKGIFDKAKENGAIDFHDYKEPEKDKFGGGGYTLGNTTNTSRYVAPTPETGPVKIVLTFFKNGFSVDDGEKRDFDDMANKEFMEDINAGVIPRELERQYPGREIHVELVDKKGDDYKEPPKPSVVPFSGSGHSLGSSTGPTVVTTNVAEEQIVVDESAPKASMRIRLASGGNVTIKCNMSHTVGDIYAHLKALNPSIRNFELKTSYPVSTLSDLSATVESAGLKGASLIQHSH